MRASIEFGEGKDERLAEARFITRRAVAAAGFAIAFGLLFWYAADLFLLGFLGLLFAIFLRSLSDPLARFLRLNDHLALWLVTLLLIGAFWLLGWMFSADIARQFEELSERIPIAMRELQRNMEKSEFGQQLIWQLNHLEKFLQRPGTLAKATTFLSATFGAIASIALIFIMGFFVAFSPESYVNGIVRLSSPSRRPRTRQILNTLGMTLRSWIVGKAVEMLFIGVVTYIGLQLLNVQLSLVLGILAALLTFIPYFGPTIAAFPAVLMALVESPRKALYVVALYVVVQIIEGNILAPLIERRTVFLPPALTIFCQLLAALLFGFLGVLLASPLTAVILVLVRMLYVEDVLEKHANP